jgi:exonuclease SbcC
MIPITTHIKNFGPHRDTRIDWNKTGTLSAIVADNGTGKTFAVEADFACLFGEFPGRPGSLYANASFGAQEACIETVFVVRGRTYRALRNVRNLQGKTPTQETLLHDHETGELLAGPKQKDFEPAIEALVGTKEMALATWFSSQGTRGDLTTIAPSERHEIYARLLELAKLEKIAEKAGKKAGEANAKAEVLEAQASAATETDSTVGQLREELTFNHNKHTGVSASVAVLREDLAAEQARLAQLDGNDEQFNDRIRRHEQARADVTKREADLSGLTARVRQLREKADKLPEAEKADKDLREIEKRVNALTMQRGKWDRRQNWERTRDRLKAALDTANATITAMESQPGLDEETRAKAWAVDVISDEYRQADAENKARKARNTERQDRRNALEYNTRETLKELERLRSRIATKPATPGAPDDCARCPLLKEFADIPAQIEKHAARHEELRATVIESDEDLIDTADIVRRGTEAREAQKLVAAARQREEQLTLARNGREEAAAALARHEATAPELVEDPTEALNTATVNAENLRTRANMLPVCVQAAEDLKRENARLAELNEELRIAQETEAALRTQAEEARHALASRATQRQKIKATVATLKAEITAQEREQTRLAGEIGRIEQRIKEVEQRLRENARKRREAHDLRLKAKRLDTLRVAFGKRGAQALLVDNAMPQLEQIAAEMLDKLTGGRFAVRFPTQKTNKDGSTAEKNSILVWDGERERDVLTYSGGEKRMLQTVIRLAVAEWTARLKGLRPDHLRIDEALDALDGENSTRLLDLLRSLESRYEKIIIITHDAAIAERLPGRIRLTKHFGGVTVEINSQEAAA